MDTNVLVRHLVNEPSEQTDRARNLMGRIAAREEEVVLTDSVVVETVFVLAKLYGVERAEVAQSLRLILSQQGLILANIDTVFGALDFWASHPSLSFPDCFHLVTTKALGLDQIYTFDKKMNRYPGVERIEP
jgi:predicted nucleic acid-binding protein